MNWRCNGITGHRGNPAALPENTLPSFQNAIDIGVDWLETDVRITRDGRLVLSHDADMLRTCGVKMAICDTDYAELKKLNVAVEFNQSHPELEPVTAEMPLLEEAFELIRGQDQVRLSLQPKDDCVDMIVRIAREMKVTDWIGFNDGSLAKMSRARQLLPDTVIFYDTYGAELAERLAEARRNRFDSLVSHYDFVTPDWVKQVKEAGFEPGIWTVNEKSEMRRFMEMGVYRFYTDYPELLREVKHVY